MWRGRRTRRPWKSSGQNRWLAVKATGRAWWRETGSLVVTVNCSVHIRRTRTDQHGQTDRPRFHAAAVRAETTVALNDSLEERATGGFVGKPFSQPVDVHGDGIWGRLWFTILICSDGCHEKGAPAGCERAPFCLGYGPEKNPEGEYSFRVTSGSYRNETNPGKVFQVNGPSRHAG